MNDRLNAIPVVQTTAAAAEELEQSLYEVRQKIYPRAVRGWFAGWRWSLVWLTQIVFYGLPWLQWNDRQAVLFDLASRKFYILGFVFWPQDFIYLTGLLIIAAYSLFLFTAVGGRLWCGYACPQTVYTEIFMWIERKVEGDRQRRIRLDAEPLGARKLGLKTAKHGLWIALALWTGITFVGYFTPIRELLGHALAFELGPWEAFWVFFYGFATYGNAGWMREQVCKYMCPYARFQSAMFDKDTMIVTYDAARGEPRGARSKKADYRAQGLGSCVDCTMCVQVCPTGIDIRNGLQYECIGCAACIDACNQVMDKMGYPQGLIRYTTTARVASAHPHLYGDPLPGHRRPGVLAVRARAAQGGCPARPRHADPGGGGRKAGERLPPADHEHPGAAAALSHRGLGAAVPDRRRRDRDRAAAGGHAPGPDKAPDRRGGGGGWFAQDRGGSRCDRRSGDQRARKSRLPGPLDSCPFPQIALP